MSLDDDLTKAVTEAIMQEASYKLGDVLNGFPPGTQVFVLVVMQRLVDLIKPMLSEKDQELFGHLYRHTSVVAAPASLDPRKQEEDG